jgi:hypothetical protein
MPKLTYLSFVLLTLSGTHVDAADIFVQRDTQNGISLVGIDGVIEASDDRKFSNKVFELDKAVVVLNSPGGSALAGIEIGKTIRLKGFATIVPEKGLCASACALIWLGGMPRLISDNANLGFHATYIEKDGKLLESGVGNALVGRYLTLLNLPERAVIFVTNAPPTGMNWFNRLNQSHSAIEATFVNIQKENAPTARKALDPIATVRTFYEYLSQGEGGAAAALVIPEKRGIGAFNEKNMTAYFGGLKRRLQLGAVYRENDGRILVSYDYTRQDGFYCSTTASVTIRESFERLMIEKILAKC